MKHCLLLLGVVAALAMGAPAAYSQAIGMDVDGDTDCDADDVITSTTTAVDVYLDTNGLSDEDACTGGASELNMFGYDVIIASGGSGTLNLSTATWTNQISSFTVNLNPVQKSSGAFSIGWSAPLGTTLPAGLYRIGTLNITASGSPTLSFLETSPFGTGSPVTGFGTDCSQINGLDMTNPSTATLGSDPSFDACGTAAGTPTNTTTWGAIKNLYR